MNPLIIKAEERLKMNANLVGGKALNLSLLQQTDVNVPGWYVITTEAFRIATQSISEEILLELQPLIELRSKPTFAIDPTKVNTVSKNIRDKIMHLEMPKLLYETLQIEHFRLMEHSQFFSVRSSAIDEDTSGSSFAGLHDSFLFVPDFNGLLNKICRVWASAFNTRALIFRLQNEIPIDRIAIAVIVQLMISANRSGIVFTANPNTGNVHEILVSALYGAGEGIVSAGLDADLYTIAKSDLSFTSVLAKKSEQLLLDRATESGLKRTEVAKQLQAQNTLTSKEIREIALLSLNIEKSFGKPQDIEFSMDRDGKLWILQTRPITTIGENGPAAGNRLIWDNSNIIESYSGLTSPLTFSFIRQAYAIVYRGFAEIMGVDAKTLRLHHYVFENMLGIFHGRVYYNILNWYLIISLFPGFAYNKGFLESMLGMKNSVEYEPPRQSQTFFYRYFWEPILLIRLSIQTFYNFTRLEKLITEFENRFEFHFNRWKQIDFNRLKPHELMNLYFDMEESLLLNWKTPTINDFFVMIFYGLLKKLCTNWCEDKDGTLQNDLICGEGDILSTAPAQMTMDIASTISANKSWRVLFQNLTPAELALRVPNDNQLTPIWQSIQTYLQLYGYRRINELKLEEPTLIENPEFIYRTLKNYLSMDPARLTSRAINARNQGMRSNAEAKVFSILGRRSAKTLLFRLVLRNARLGVRNRENLRIYRTRIYGMLRELILAMGIGFEQEGILKNHADIFYLTINEIWDFIKGTAVTTNLQGLADLRQTEYNKWRLETGTIPDDRFETYGVACYRNNYQMPAPAKMVQEELQGIGCCPGQVTAKVRVLRSPAVDISLNGEILAARSTDPGWVPIFPSVSGILIEHGSILSHSAIVAREMGIPIIVGIKGLFDTLQDGQTVKMDGATGVVILVNS
jgi:rifampicin phosphotransferase